MKTETPGVASETIDRLSLEQALRDAEIAIARSRDLTFRLVELRSQLAGERENNQLLQDQLDETRQLYEAIQGNKAYKLAARIWTLRQALGV